MKLTKQASRQLHCDGFAKSNWWCIIYFSSSCSGTGKEVGDRHPKVNDNVLIGANATILGNITIGKGAQVAAGSLVLKDVPPRTMVAGSPAKEVGRVTGDMISHCPSSLLGSCLSYPEDSVESLLGSWEVGKLSLLQGGQ